MLKEPPRPFSSAALLLYAFSLVGFFCSTTNGYDGSLFGTLLANKAFTGFFNVQDVGIWTGIVTSMYQIGSVVAIPFIGPAIDTFGRKFGMFIAAFIIVIGVVIQGACVHTASVGQFMGGRFLLGFGVGIIGSAGPIYVVEISHPAHRGVVTGLYNVFWPVGAIVASGAARGGLNYTGNTSWLIPVWLQIMFPGLIVLLVWFLPESPRWLYVHGKPEKAKATLAKFHGNGNPESEWIKLQLWEYEAHLEMNGADKRWWDYRAVFKNRASLYRLMSNCLVSLFGQWAGNGVVSYFLVGFLVTAGVTDSITQNNLAVGMNAVQIVFAGLGALFVDKLGRRKMLIGVNAACCVCWIGVTVACSQAAMTGSKAASAATVAMVYIFQVCYSFGWTPMQALYPVEVLSFEMRAKGMAFSNLFVSVGKSAWVILPSRLALTVCAQVDLSTNLDSPSLSRTSAGRPTSSSASGAPSKPSSSTSSSPRPRTARSKSSTPSSTRRTPARPPRRRRSWSSMPTRTLCTSKSWAMTARSDRSCERLHRDHVGLHIHLFVL